MTLLAALPDGPATVDGGEAVYLRHPSASPDAIKRTLTVLTPYFLGPTPASLRAFYGKTPIAQPAGALQAAVATSVGAAVVGTAATNAAPYGYATAAQANDVVSRVNQLRADVIALTALVGQLRSDFVNLGLIKGSA